MSGSRYFTVRVSPATDVPSVIRRIRLALGATDSCATDTSGPAGSRASLDAMLGLLAETATRFQNELGNSGTRGETLLSMAGLRIKITTRPQKPIERIQSALFKSRVTFV